MPNWIALILHFYRAKVPAQLTQHPIRYRFADTTDIIQDLFAV